MHVSVRSTVASPGHVVHLRHWMSSPRRWLISRCRAESHRGLAFGLVDARSPASSHPPAVSLRIAARCRRLFKDPEGLDRCLRHNAEAHYGACLASLEHLTIPTMRFRSSMTASTTHPRDLAEIPLLPALSQPNKGLSVARKSAPSGDGDDLSPIPTRLRRHRGLADLISSADGRLRTRSCACTISTPRGQQ